MHAKTIVELTNGPGLRKLLAETDGRAKTAAREYMENFMVRCFCGGPSCSPCMGSKRMALTTEVRRIFFDG